MEVKIKFLELDCHFHSKKTSRATVTHTAPPFKFNLLQSLEGGFASVRKYVTPLFALIKEFWLLSKRLTLGPFMPLRNWKVV